MEIAGLPLHPLVVHAAVVLTPLAVGLVALFAVAPRHRWLTRWPMVATTLAALVSVWVARLSGGDLVEALPGIEEVIETHRERGELLSLLMIGLSVLVVAGALLLGGPSALTSGWGAQESRGGVLDKALPVLLLAAAAVVLVWVMLTGDAGSRAVWG